MLEMLTNLLIVLEAISYTTSYSCCITIILMLLISYPRTCSVAMNICFCLDHSLLTFSSVDLALKTESCWWRYMLIMCSLIKSWVKVLHCKQRRKYEWMVGKMVLYMCMVFVSLVYSFCMGLLASLFDLTSSRLAPPLASVLKQITT